MIDSGLSPLLFGSLCLSLSPLSFNSPSNKPGDEVEATYDSGLVVRDVDEHGEDDDCKEGEDVEGLGD